MGALMPIRPETDAELAAMVERHRVARRIAETEGRRIVAKLMLRGPGENVELCRGGWWVGGNWPPLVPSPGGYSIIALTDVVREGLAVWAQPVGAVRLDFPAGPRLELVVERAKLVDAEGTAA